MMHKIKFLILGVLLGFALKTLQQELQIRFSEVYMLRNPYRVTNHQIDRLLNGKEGDREIAYILLKRTYNKMAEEYAKKDLNNENEDLRRAALSYLHVVDANFKRKSD